MSEPRHFGRYQVIEHVTAGPLTELYRARLEGIAGFRRMFGIHALRANFADDEAVAEAIEGEARRAAQLAHGNLVQVLDLGRQDGVLYLVTEWVDGWTLTQIFDALNASKARFPVMHAVWIALQLLKGLEYAHLREQYHDAISPACTLIGRGGDVKLTDFGLARAVRQVATQRADWAEGLATPCPPERLEGAEAGVASDLWGVTAVLYQMLTSEAPQYPKSGDPKAVSAFRDDVSAELSDVISDALARDLSKRPADLGALRQRLTDAVQGQSDAFPQSELASWLVSIFGEAQTKDELPPVEPVDLSMMAERFGSGAGSSGTGELALDDEDDIKTAIGSVAARIVRAQAQEENTPSQASPAKASPRPVAPAAVDADDVAMLPDLSADVSDRSAALAAGQAGGWGVGALVVALILGLAGGFALAQALGPAPVGHSGTLHVQVAGEPVRIAIDGREVSAPTEVSAGAHRIDLAADPSSPFSMQTEVAAGTCQVLVIDRRIAPPEP